MRRRTQSPSRRVRFDEEDPESKSPPEWYKDYVPLLRRELREVAGGEAEPQRPTLRRLPRGLRHRTPGLGTPVPRAARSSGADTSTAAATEDPELDARPGPCEGGSTADSAADGAAVPKVVVPAANSAADASDSVVDASVAPSPVASRSPRLSCLDAGAGDAGASLAGDADAATPVLGAGLMSGTAPPEVASVADQRVASWSPRPVPSCADGRSMAARGAGPCEHDTAAAAPGSPEASAGGLTGEAWIASGGPRFGFCPDLRPAAARQSWPCAERRIRSPRSSLGATCRH